MSVDYCRIMATSHEMAVGIRTILDLLYEKAHLNYVGKVTSKTETDPDPALEKT